MLSEFLFQRYFKEKEKGAENFIKILASANIIILIILSSIILYLLLNWSIIVSIFDFFEKNNLISIFAAIDSGKLILIITGFFLYLYLFGYIRSRPLTIFDEKDEGTKYLLIFDKCIEIFTPTIVILLFLFYLFDLHFFKELFWVTLFFLIFTNLAVFLFLISNKIKMNYDSIRRINNYKFVKDEYLTFNDKIGSFLKSVTGLSDMIKDLFLLLSISFIIIGWNLNWNIFSLIILTIGIIILYVAHNVVTSIPKNSVNLIFNDETRNLTAVYILKQTIEGDLLVLTRRDELRYIIKENISEIQLNESYSYLYS